MELNYTTLTQFIEANNKDANKGITFIQSGDQEQFISYAVLFEEALTLLGKLQKELNLHDGNEVIIYEEDSHKLLVCFWACILGGMIPVPLAIGGKDEHKLKLFKVWNTLNSPFLFTNELNFKRLEDFGIKNNLRTETALLKTNFIDSAKTFESYVKGEVVKRTPESVAFIQFSSGSTGDPKGVILTHENLAYNTLDLMERQELNVDDNALNWIPLTHDMGMIAFHLTCMLAGCNQYIMPTNLFIRRPLLWMEKAHQHSATHMYSPNFGFQYFLQALDRQSEPQQWDLKNVRSILNGAEPIAAGLCREFTSSLSPYQMPKTSVVPCYGLAEASVGVTCNVMDSQIKEYFLERNSLAIGKKAIFTDEYVAEKIVSFVDVGIPFDHCKVRITNDQDEVLENEVIGHIEISGPNVTQGYYQNPAATDAVMTTDGWVRTGDLGMLMDGGSLIITGRHKNMIILQGQNYYAHDIEGILLGVSDISLGKIVACGIPGDAKNKEQLIIFLLHKKSVAKFIPIVKSVQQKLSEVLGIIPDQVVPIREVPKTTSGKVQHGVLLKRFIDGNFDEIVSELNQEIIKEQILLWNELTEKARFTAIQEWVCLNSANLVRAEAMDLDVNEPLGDQGFKSIHAVQLSQLLNKRLGLSTAATILYEYPTISQLVTFIVDQLFHEGNDPTMSQEEIVSDDDSLLHLIDNMSDEEVMKMLEEE